MIRKIINYSHNILLLYFVLFPYITPIEYLKKATYFWCLTVYHWYFLGGRCWMSILEDQFKSKDEPKTNVTNVFSIIGLPNYTFDIIVHTNILFAFYQLDMLLYGIWFFYLTLQINRILYKSYLFK